MNKIDELLLEFEAITKLLREASEKWSKLSAAQNKNIFNLTEKELEVYELFKSGLSLDEITNKLQLSIKTTTAHRDHIRKKLGLKSAKEFYRHLKDAR